MNRRAFCSLGVAFLSYPREGWAVPAGRNWRDVRTREEWRQMREQAWSAMQEVMGELPASREPVRIEVRGEEHLPGFRRRTIAYTGGDGDWVPAYLLLPEKRRRSPAVVCLHQTTKIGKGEPAGVGGKPNLQYAAELAREGFITLAPDYPNFGDYAFDPYAAGYASATMKGIVNHRRAVDAIQTLREWNGRPVGVIGHSLGGHNSLFLASFDDRVGAAVTSCGFTRFARYMKGDLTGWTHRGYMPRIASVYGKSPERVPFDFTDILAAIAPRPVFISAPVGDDNFDVTGVRECVEEVEPVYRRVFGAGGKLVARYPDCGHDFPPEVRREAYRYLKRWLA